MTLSGKIVEHPVFNTKVAYEVVPDDEGWRPWYPTKDSKCPVEPECTVVYEMNIGTTYTAVSGTLDWTNLDWTNMGDYHIIRYKAVADDTATESEYDICIYQHNGKERVRVTHLASVPHLMTSIQLT